MRCTRCDRPAVPQAVGRTPEGDLVFGWCLPCLEAGDCREIVVARRPRRNTTRLALERRPPRPSRYYRPRSPLDERRSLAASVALSVALWGFVLLFTGLLAWGLGPPRSRSPLGNGTPALLIGGGGTTVAVGLILWAAQSGRDLLRSRLTLKVIQGLGFLAAVGTLLAGVVFRSPRNDSLVVGLASAALTVSAAARWIEVRKSRPVAT